MQHFFLFVLASSGPALAIVDPSGQNRCGGSNQWTCPSNFGCCSQYGWCGTSADHCGIGNQARFNFKTTDNTAIALLNSIWDPCGKVWDSDGLKSQFGCGDGLVCGRLVSNNPYLQCLPTPALDKSLWRPCTISQIKITGKGTADTTCAVGSFCDGEVGRTAGYCQNCRTKYTTCGPSAYQHADTTLCCPDTICTKVTATVAGQVGSKYVCLPSTLKKRGLGDAGSTATLSNSSTSTSTSTTPILGKRAVGANRPTPTSYCFSGCQGIKIL